MNPGMDELANRRIAPTPSVPPKVKGTRPPNEIDFWRGFALIAIFINHVPGIFFERFTHRNFGFSDSAELFVLLAGLVLARHGRPVAQPRSRSAWCCASAGGRWFSTSPSRSSR